MLHLRFMPVCHTAPSNCRVFAPIWFQKNIPSYSMPFVVYSFNLQATELIYQLLTKQSTNFHII